MVSDDRQQGDSIGSRLQRGDRSDASCSERAGNTGPVVRPVSSRPIPPPNNDPVLAWLDSDKAVRYQGQWVALDSTTGQFLGETDDIRSWRVFRERGALVIFVDPRDPESPVYDLIVSR